MACGMKSEWIMFYLMLYMQEEEVTHILLQTSSTYNHRIWVEVNKRVTYPIKAVVTINMDSSADKYCVCLEE